MLIISHRSAFLYWRNFLGNVNTLSRVMRHSAMTCEDKPATFPLEELAALGLLVSKESPLDLLFSSKASRFQSEFVHVHISNIELPLGSLLRLTPNIAIVSPELCFLQMSQRFSPERLALAGTEMCGTYAIIGSSGELSTRLPLSSKKALVEYLERVYSGKWSQASRALPYVLDNAASSMEAKLALLLSLPTNWGGYGLPLPQLNARIPLGDAARKLYPHGYCKADLYWADANLDVEYDGELAHTGEMYAKDIARAAALAKEGVSIIVVDAAQIKSCEKLTEIAGSIATALNKSFRIRVHDYKEKQDTLRRELQIREDTPCGMQSLRKAG